MRMVAPFAQRLPGTKVVMDQEKNKMRSLVNSPITRDVGHWRRSVLPPALQQEFMSLLDLGAGKKAGAEIFGRLAALFSMGGAPIAIFDVMTAFKSIFLVAMR